MWQETRSLSKKEIVDRCFEMCSVKNVVKSRSSRNAIVVGYDHHQIHIQTNFSDLVKVYSAPKHNASAHDEVTATVGNQSDDDADIILQHLPPELVKKLDTDSLAIIRSASQIVSMSSYANKEEPTPAENEKKDLSTILRVLYQHKASNFDITESQLSSMLKTAESINKSFTCEELKIILKQNDQKTSGIRKANMVTSISQL